MIRVQVHPTSRPHSFLDTQVQAEMSHALCSVGQVFSGTIHDYGGSCPLGPYSEEPASSHTLHTWSHGSSCFRNAYYAAIPNQLLLLVCEGWN